MTRPTSADEEFFRLPVPAGLDAVAAAKWDEMAGPACWGDRLRPEDADILADYCAAHARKVRAAANLAEYGDLVKGANGYPTASPWLAVQRGAIDLMHQIAANMRMRSRRK